MQSKNTRRDFIKLSALGFGVAILAPGLAVSDERLSSSVKFLHGVASGDPLHDRVILWTRVTHIDKLYDEPVRIAWQVAIDPEFTFLVNTGSIATTADQDYTIKIDAAGLSPDTKYYYRFLSQDQTSVVGQTRTLPSHTETVKLAVVSCSNFPAGRFHVYREIAKRNDLNAVLHLGDYIYEYERGGYASANAAALDREVLPKHEILNLSDYRTRYAQYRSDNDLQDLHRKHPVIAVWDDHEIANDAWREGAENHQPDEGPFEDRKFAALRAYAEWMPIRLGLEEEEKKIFRSFIFGDLVALHMLDTRIIGRDRPIEYTDYITKEGINLPQALADINDPNRSLLGDEQREWLSDQLHMQNAVWQVLGQQVLMGKMYLPAALATQQISIQDFARLAQLAQMAALGFPLSPEDLAFLGQNQALLTLPSVPYNLDAWDGFEAERQNILETARANQSNLVVLSGDTHNAWANNLVDASNQACGVEFATPSVSSPGLEEYLRLSPQEVIPVEQQITALVTHLQYTNLSDRGFMVVTFTRQEAKAEFHFVDNILSETYRMLEERTKTVSVKVNQNRISG